MKPLTHARSLLVGLAWLGFACRLLVPAGYMPASPEEGFIKLCPSGVAGALFSAASQVPAVHNHGASPEGATHEHAGEHAYGTEYCPAGVFFSAAVAVPGFDVSILQLQFARPADRESAVAAAPRFLSHQPRAPPVQPV